MLHCLMFASLVQCLGRDSDKPHERIGVDREFGVLHLWYRQGVPLPFNQALSTDRLSRFQGTY